MAALQLALSLGRRLRHHMSAHPFNQPVDHIVHQCPDYFEVIKHPMDLSTVQHKLKKDWYFFVKEV